MSRTRYNHPLSQEHLRIVARHSPHVGRQMHAVWAVSWRPGSGRASFMDTLFRPVGSAICMAQISQPADQADAEAAARNGRPSAEHIALFGITARVEPEAARISYDNCRLAHEFQRTPFVNASGRTLDPSSDGGGPRRRGNASWVRLALDLYQARKGAVNMAFKLSPTPQLPEIYLGYSSQDRVPYFVTDGLIARAAADQEIRCDRLSQLRSLHADQLKQFMQMPAEWRSARQREAWEAAIVPPHDPANNTGRWLLPHDLCESVISAVDVFEYFGGLTGTHVFNPAKRLGEKQVANPARQLAKAAGFDLDATLKQLTSLAEGVDQAAEQQIVGLVPAMRTACKVSAEITDDDLCTAICSPDEKVRVRPALDTLSDEAAVVRMRAELLPRIRESCDDASLLAAARAPNSPLFAAGMVRTQLLHRDPHVPPLESLQFTDRRLGRDRVEATFWYEPVVRNHGDADVAEVASGTA